MLWIACSPPAISDKKTASTVLAVFVYSLLSTFFCQDLLAHLGHFRYLVVPMCMEKATLLNFGTYRFPHSSQW